MILFATNSNISNEDISLKKISGNSEQKISSSLTGQQNKTSGLDHNEGKKLKVFGSILAVMESSIVHT